ncbi:AAA family ATPase [Fictibacillus enclensis]|uniref:ATP-dependent nuclease n=1 Tax=Fictibacillus enclensis TaxID=1017270 RepID=UPI0025A086DA|nr:AAA family ATPase [Fictibacillus enclensis]MDM5197593.1 AAA family ATPase [Fictibacillus enclensis]
MKLKRLIVSNFRGLKGGENDIDFEGSDIIFLIGKNNFGKSTFLHAYNFFVEPKIKATINDFYNKDTSIPIEITGVFMTEEDDEKDTALKKEDPDWINKWVDEEGYIIIKKAWSNQDAEGKKKTFNPRTNEFQEGGFGGFDTLLKKYSPTAIPINAVSSPEELEKEINDIITKKHIKKLETEYSDKYSAIIDGLKDLKEDISKSNDINNINIKMNTFFSGVFPELELKIYSLPEAGVDISKTLKATHGLSVKDKEMLEDIYDLKNNGHGVMRQAFFSFLSTLGADLEKTRKEYLILFEEPELYLHPEAVFSLREQLYKLAKNSPFQVLCATHSPLMIDTAKPHSSLVRLVKEQRKNTKTYQVKFDLFEEEEKNFLQMINRFNPHICECFFADEVILVEGDTEAIVYRDLISRFYKSKDVFVLNTGSKANMVFYQKILTHFGIKHVVVHDVDSPTYIASNGVEKVNAMWTFNKSIWDQIIESNQLFPNISRRFVHHVNFESAHNYKENKTKGKPLSAYEFARSINVNSNLPCMQLLDDIFGECNINHTQDYLEGLLISSL